MSDVHDTTTAAETPAVETAATQQPEETKAEVPQTEPEAPAAESSQPEETTDAVTETKDEAAVPTEKKDEVAPVEKKPVEPITEGQLALKGPGLLKSIIPSKKEFWLSDDAVSPQNLNFYMRGEKPDISHPVVAWASQTGKGLLFFNKKGETSRKQPGHVIALYDVTDLKKQTPHEIVFKLHGQEIVMKAANDNERDGWFVSIEKGAEIAKAQKEEIRESEGYKAEMEKLNKPITYGGGAAVAANRSQSQPTKSTEADKAEETKRKDSDLEDDKKDKKSRSNSRGVLGRLNRKKDELETKKEEKKEEKEEKKTEKEDSKPEEDGKVEEGAVAGTAVAGAAAAEGATSEDKKEETTEEKKVEPKPEEKTKSSKRGSIFGKIQGLGGVKSPSKEKDQKDVEMKPEVPPKDAPVSENPPQLPEPATETAAEAEASKTETEAKPEAAEEKKDATTPGKEKNTFLSGIPFINKRNRSVSPSTNMKEVPVKTEEAAPAEVPEEPEPVEEGKTDEAIAETTAVEPLKPETAKPEEKENRRQSVLGSLGRRASKAFKGIQTPKKENAAPAASTKKEETTEAAPAADKPVTNGETKPAEPEQPQQQIGDVVPDAVNVGKAENQPPTVTASA